MAKRITGGPNRRESLNSLDGSSGRRRPKLVDGRVSAKVPFEFVLDALLPKSPSIKRMFGCFAVYVGEKIVLMLREKFEHASDNGVWIATSKEDHISLKREFPSMRSIRVLGRGVTGWQVIPSSADDFESSVTHACELVLRGDPRIGKIPKKKRKTTAMQRRARSPASIR